MMPSPSRAPLHGGGIFADVIRALRREPARALELSLPSGALQLALFGFLELRDPLVVFATRRCCDSYKPEAGQLDSGFFRREAGLFQLRVCGFGDTPTGPVFWDRPVALFVRDLDFAHWMLP